MTSFWGQVTPKYIAFIYLNHFFHLCVNFCNYCAICPLFWVKCNTRNGQNVTHVTQKYHSFYRNKNLQHYIQYILLLVSIYSINDYLIC